MDILLQHGAQPNGKYEDSTAWGHFLQSMNRGWLGDDHMERMLPIAHSLLFHGANPKELIAIERILREEEYSKLFETAREFSESLPKAQKDQKSNAAR